MNSKTEKDKNKALQDKFQAILSQMLREEDNKFCVDCDTKGPRWASWNLGIFLCIRCAGIHRNLGVHVSRVKSVNLDSWTAEQVAMMKEMGNSRARAVYEANLPDNYRRPLTDSGLETFIRQKYEDKKYIAREWIPPKLDITALQLDDVSDVTPRGTSTNNKYSRSRPVSTVETTSQARPRLSADTRQVSVTSGGVPAEPQQVQGQGQGRAAAAPNTDLLGSIDVAAPAAAAAAVQNSSVDLLGISFSSSVNVSTDHQRQSAAGAEAAPSQSAWPQTEVDLFGEGSSSEQRRKMDKENILKLYASAPAPAGPMYMMQQQQQQMMYGMNPVQGPMAMHQMAYGPPSNAMMAGWGGAMPAAQQPHPMTMMPSYHPGAVPSATNYNFVPGTFGQPHYYQQASSMPQAVHYGAQAPPMAMPNRYPGEQMTTNGAMMSSQAPPYSGGHTLSSQLWQ